MSYEIIYTAHDENGDPAADGWTEEDDGTMSVYDTALEWLASLCEDDAARCGIYSADHTRHVTLSITARRETEHSIEEHTEEVQRVVPAGAGLDYVPEPPAEWRLLREGGWWIVGRGGFRHDPRGDTAARAVRDAYRRLRWAGVEKALIALLKRGRR